MSNSETVKIPIWGKTIPYNSKKSKLDDMELNSVKDAWDALMQLAPHLAGTEISDCRSQYDTMSYEAEIKPGIACETYEDVPFLTPYLVEGSDKVVLVVPGGGFAYKQSDIDIPPSGEGMLTAMRLNEAGISAFVLWYRNNPYRFPTCLIDMQRAVRYIRYHASDYGYHPEKIGCIGFSAGGFLCASQTVYMRNCKPQADGYVPDEVDRVSDQVALAGLIYPCLNFKTNMNLLHVNLGEDIWDEEKRVAFLDEYDMTTKVCRGDAPQFISYGTEDAAIGPEGIYAYRDALDKNKVEYIYQSVVNANHGFSGQQEFAYWAKTFTDWANMIFSRMDSSL